MSNNAPSGSEDANFSRQVANWFPMPALVDPDQYTSNKAKIEHMREALDQFERQNEAGLSAYEQQRLMQIVEVGKQAEYVPSFSRLWHDKLTPLQKAVRAFEGGECSCSWVRMFYVPESSFLTVCLFLDLAMLLRLLTVIMALHQHRVLFRTAGNLLAILPCIALFRCACSLIGLFVANISGQPQNNANFHAMQHQQAAYSAHQVPQGGGPPASPTIRQQQWATNGVVDPQTRVPYANQPRQPIPNVAQGHSPIPAPAPAPPGHFSRHYPSQVLSGQVSHAPASDPRNAPTGKRFCEYQHRLINKLIPPKAVRSTQQQPIANMSTAPSQHSGRSVVSSWYVLS